MTTTRIIGISGSLRSDSHNTRLLRAAAGLTPEGVELELWSDLRSIPPFDEDEERDPAAPVTALREAIAGADAVLFATPEYNSSIPGQLKNALDWVSRPIAENALRNVPVAVIGASTGAFGAVWAQAELRKVLGAMGGRVVEAELALGHAHQQLDADGQLVEHEQREQLGEVVTLLAEAAALRAARIPQALAA